MAKAATAAKPPAKKVPVKVPGAKPAGAKTPGKTAPVEKAAIVRPSLKMLPMEAGNESEVTSGLKSTKVYAAPIEAIMVVPQFNLRVTDNDEYKQELKNLATSINLNGFYNTKPLAGFVAKVGETSKLVITDGHRRFEAVKVVNAVRLKNKQPTIDTLPMILKKPTTSALEMTMALYNENTGKRISMIEMAVLAKRLIDSGMKGDEIAKQLSVTERYVKDLLLLMRADAKEARALVMAGKLSGTEVVKRLRQAEKDGGDDKEAAKSNAIAAMKDLVSKAEAKGKGKATAGDDEPSERTVRTKMAYSMEAGQIVEWAEISGFAGLFPDTAWYEATDHENKVKIVENVTFKGQITRPFKEDEPEAEAEPAPAKKRGRPAKVEEDGPGVGVEVDPLTMGELDDADAPNLAELGIADPTEDPDL